MKGPIRVFRSYQRRFQLKLTVGVELLRPLVDQGLGWLRRIVSGGVPDGWLPSLEQKPSKGPLNQSNESEYQVTETISTEDITSTQPVEAGAQANTECAHPSMFDVIATPCDLVRTDVPAGEVVLLLDNQEVYRAQLPLPNSNLGPYADKNEESAAQGHILADLCNTAMADLKLAYYGNLNGDQVEKKEGGVHLHFKNVCLISVHGPVTSIREIAAQGYLQIRKFIEKLAEVGKIAQMLQNMDTDRPDDEESRCPLKGEFVEGARLIVTFGEERIIDAQELMADQLDAVKKLGLPPKTASGAALSWGMDQLKAAVDGEVFSKAPVGNELKVEQSDGNVATATLGLTEVEGSVHLHFGNSCIVRTKGPSVSKHDCVSHAYETVVEFAREAVRALRDEIIQTVNSVAGDDEEEEESDDPIQITVHRGAPGKDFEGNKVLEVLHKHFADQGQNVTAPGWSAWGFYQEGKLIHVDSAILKNASGIDWNRGLIPVLGWVHSSLFNLAQSRETEQPVDISAEFVVSFEGRMVTYGRGLHKSNRDMFDTALQSLEELLVAVRKMPQGFFENEKAGKPAAQEGAGA